MLALRAVDQQAGATLEAVQKLDLQQVAVQTIQTIEVQLGEEENVMKKSKAEIFNVLCLRTTDEAKNIVRGVEDMDGYVAWKKLYDRFNPRTPASWT